MKNLAKLNGAKALSKKEQKSINGGRNWNGYCFPAERKCNYYCSVECHPNCGGSVTQFYCGNPI